MYEKKHYETYAVKGAVTISLPGDLVRRMDRQSRIEGVSRSGMVERWLRAGERQASLSSLEEELERYYSRPHEQALGAALGRAAREAASDSVRRRRRSR
jgi:hypothetical protein